MSIAERLQVVTAELRVLEGLLASACNHVGWGTPSGIMFHDRLREVRNARFALDLSRQALEEFEGIG